MAVLVGCGAKTGLTAPEARDEPEPEPEEPDVRCVIVEPDGEPTLVSFELEVRLAVIDLFFLLDSTASMRDEIDNVRESLAEVIVPAVRDEVPNAAFGLALLGEFPFDPYGPPEVQPYELRVPITQDFDRIIGALNEFPSWGNFDDPEAQVEALYQVATGEGFGSLIPASFGCPMGGTGAACFRPDAFPVIMLVTDAPFHNGPPGVEPVDNYTFTPAPHTYQDAVDALNDIGVFVVGLGARDAGAPSPMPHLRELASDTGALTAEGQSLAIDIGSGGEVDRGVIDAIQRLAGDVPLDVDAIVLDAPGDAIDARELVASIRPVSIEPSSAGGITADGFAAVEPGARVSFEITIDASALPGVTGEVPARVRFRAFRRSVLDEQDIVLVIGEPSERCFTE